MSSFKRRAPSSGTVKAQPLPPPGTRPNAANSAIRETSIGVPSLDDVLGGGIPMGSIIVLLTPDIHSNWGELLQRYYVAQGLANGQAVHVVGQNPRELVDGCMWSRDSGGTAEKSEDEGERDGGDVKIAWRYESMKKFKTTVGAGVTDSEYTNTFELTQKIPELLVEEALEGGQLSLASIDVGNDNMPYDSILETLRKVESTSDEDSGTGPTAPARQRVTRISLPNLGGPDWGDSSPSRIMLFLYLARSLVQSKPVTVLITLPPHLSQASPTFDVGPPADHWIQKIGFLCDGCISLSSFGADQALAGSFPTYHGFVHVHRAPSVQSLVPPSDKLSVLRGLSSPSSHTGGGGENNLGFRCTRKRFVIETLHLDVEGGVGERRTAPPPSAHGTKLSHSHSEKPKGAGAPKVSIEAPEMHSTPSPTGDASEQPARRKKSAKVVAFQKDVYDF